MLLPQFDYLAPSTLAEALEIKARLGSEAVWLAGGTDLLPRAKQGLAGPSTVISLKNLGDELRGVSVQEGRLVIGAMTTLKQAGAHPEVQARLPGLADALSAIGAETMQQRVGTVGGNLCADTRCLYLNQSKAWRSGLAPCFKLGGEVCHPGGATADRCRSVCQSDGAIMLMALGGSVLLAGDQGRRELPLEEFFTGKGEAPLAMRADELMLNVSVGLEEAGMGSAYHKMALRGAIDFPVLSAGAKVVLEGGVVQSARVSIGAVFAAPLLMSDAVKSLIGHPPTEEAIAEAARRAGSHADPFPVNNLSADLAWRKAMVPVVVRRALTVAVRRAGEAGR